MTEKRGWHNPAKQIEKHHSGKCPICHKETNNLEEHMHDKHKGKKLPK
ncbi:TPA: hypothetical protein HA265_03230 [Candidatus Woesearchaeota archaeon]|nr:hypothetical protein [Candidatus Woesearchaeota archaeon]